MSEIPSFLKVKENYHAENSSTAFVDQTLLKMTSTIYHFQKVNVKKDKENAILYFIFTFLTVLLMSFSRNMLFTYILLAYLIIHLCFFNEKALSSVLHLSIRAFLFSCLILCPSVFLTNTKTMLTVSLKVFVSASMIGILNVNYSTNEIISMLKALHISDIFIYTLDTTFKYIVILSKTSEEILTSLKCRIIGKLKKKQESVSNIAGKTFVKATNASKEMMDAMICRGFNGEYYNHMKYQWNRYDTIRLTLLLVEVVLWIWCER